MFSSLDLNLDAVRQLKVINQNGSFPKKNQSCDFSFNHLLSDTVSLSETD